jgi:hypothetical protein
MVLATAPFGPGAWAMNISVGGQASWEIYRSTGGEATTSFVVPNNTAYSVTSNYGYLAKWLELR